MPALVVTTSDGDRTYQLPEGKPLFIGRARECDIVLPSPAVSRRHAVILFKNGICGVKDLGSFNGTIINGETISQPAHLRPDDVIRISTFILKLDPAAAPEIAPVPDVQPAVSTPDAPIPDTPVAQVKAPRPDTRSFAAGIRLPRAMAMLDDVDAIMDQIPSNVAQSREQGDRPGDETVFSSDSSRTIIMKRETTTTVRLTGSEEGRRGETTGLPGPGKTGDTDADDDPGATQYDLAASGKSAPQPAPPPVVEPPTPPAPTPNDTGYFQEAPLADLLRRRLQENREMREKKAAKPSEEAERSSLAESVIPLSDPEKTPVLTLDTDPADEGNNTLTALERLIENSPPPRAPTGMANAIGLSGELPTPLRTDEFVAVATEEAAEELAGGATAVPDRSSPTPGSGSAAGADDADPSFAALDEQKKARHQAKQRARSTDTAFITPVSAKVGSERVTISPALMAAINTRLGVYSQLLDIAEERRLLRMANPSMPADIREELDRQDAEIDCLPTTDETEFNMEELGRRRNRAADDSQFESDNVQLRETVDELAMSQWVVIRDSNRQTLPAVLKEAYKLAADEPLAQDLAAAHIRHGRLLGGAVYYLALESLSHLAEGEQERISSRLQSLAEGETVRSKTSILGKLGKIGKLANKLKNREEIRTETSKLNEENRVSQLRAQLASREMAFLHKVLLREYRRLYEKTAQHFIPQHESMPFSVRAFLRHGVIGFKSWWMSEKVRDFILADVRENVLTNFEHGTEILNVLYADEYLAAVAKMECSPSPIENLAALDRSSLEWKTDRAYRRIVNARIYNVLMEEMLANLDTRMKALEQESQSLENRMNEIKLRSFATKDALFDLQTEHQAVAIRRANLAKHINRIEKEVVASIIESVQEAEGRFRKGELVLPDQQTLIANEVNALFDITKRMEGPRERFMPLAVRDRYNFKNDTMNDRGGVRTIICDCERHDPGLFMNAIIPSKKKVNRIELRLAPTIVIAPAVGLQGSCAMAREGMEGGHLVLPTCFAREHSRKRLMANVLADFRWETARLHAGRNHIDSDTLVGAFSKIRWEWRNEPKVRREKGLILNELTDQQNWRRIYEIILTDAMTGCRTLFQRNPDLYAGLIGKHIDLPDGVRPLG